MIFRTGILLSLVLNILNVFSQQEVNFSGYWSGTVGVPIASDLIGEYYIKQHGLVLEGYCKLKSMNGKDSSKHTFSGTVKNGEAHIKGTQFVYKTSPGCLSTTHLKIVEDGNQTKLIGKWFGDLSLSTCPVGVSGKIELAKEKDLPQPHSADHEQIQEQVNVSENDVEGNALLRKLAQHKYHSLIIAIDDYENEGINDLDNPINDAEILNKILQENFTFEEENTLFLKNPTRTEIIEAFDELSKKIEENDQFLIFYAGHGVWNTQLNQGFWLPSDASADSKAQWLSNSTIRDYIGGIKAKHTLLITDACFSGSIFKKRAVTFDNSKAILEMYKLKSRKAMTSGTLKTVPDKSVFLKYLAQNLKNNEQPLLSAEDLFRTFKIAVINNSPNGQVPQYGAIGQVGDEGGDFIFLKRIEK